MSDIGRCDNVTESSTKTPRSEVINKLPPGHHFHPRLFYLQDKDDLLARLRRIEGQVRGLQRMIEEGRYCVDILTQIAAIRAALNKVGLSVLESHTRGCVVGAIEEQAGDEAIAELMAVLSKFVK